MRASIPLLALLLCLGAAGAARAQPMDTYGMGSRSVALGGAVTADVEDFSANYYNPAGIVRSGELRVGVGWFGAHHEMSINDVASNVDPVHGVLIGLNVPGRIDDFRFGFGLGVHLPDQRISRTRTLPRQRPRWELYDNRGQRTYLATSLSIQPFDWLRIGGGIAFLSYSDNDLSIRGRIDIATPERSRLEHQLLGELITIRYPQVGVQVQPLPWLHFGAVYRGEFALSNDLTAEVGTPDGTGPGRADIVAGDIVIPGYFDLLTSSTNAYVPHQISFGASVEPIPNVLRISLEATWLMWSLYQSPIGTSRIVLDIEVPPELEGMIDVPDDIPDGNPLDANFSDRIVPRLGIEWTAVRDPDYVVDLRLGYFYENSPAPEQTGFSNLVDTDRHAWSLGAGLELLSLRPLLPGSLAIDAHFQYGWLPSRTHQKVSPIDPVGDYVAQGHIVAGGATVEMRFE
jgi:long-chain fatty acid transport protein